ncbi:MAG: energy transducer TonB [Acidobacteria bacterium]|nr:energy transducer TonB [Acidobacteriota bacterium]
MRMRSSQTLSVMLHTGAVLALIHLGAVQQLPLALKQTPLTWNSVKITYEMPKGNSRGGGSGHDVTPPSRGELPRASGRQLILPTTHAPEEMPALPVEPAILGESTALRSPAVIGDPRGIPGPPSDGIGGKGGIGNRGDGGGVGPNKGPGTGDGPGGSIIGGPRPGGVLRPPAVLYQIEPEFSEEARKARVEGTVVLVVEVDEQGRAQNIQLRRSLGLGLDERAIEAVKKWRFRPATQNGKPVRHPALIEVHFHLL